MTNVLIVDDERMIHILFGMFIESASDRYRLVSCLYDAANVELICMKEKIDLILMDVCTANNSSGIDATKRIREKFPTIKVLIVTSAPEYRFIEKAREAGADSFWYKDAEQAEMLSVMDRTMNGESVYPERTQEVKIGDASSYDFTPRELETLFYLATAMPTPKIAEEMCVTVETVNTHIKHLKEKTGSKNKMQLAVFASKQKLVLPEY